MGHRFGLMPYFYGVRSFRQLAISSKCHFINMPFHQHAISSTCNFIKFLFHQLAILSTCHFVNLPFCQHAISSNCHFINMPFHQIVISSTCFSSTIKTGMNCLEVAAISRNGSDVKKHLKDHLNQLLPLHLGNLAPMVLAPYSLQLF